MAVRLLLGQVSYLHSYAGITKAVGPVRVLINSGFTGAIPASQHAPNDDPNSFPSLRLESMYTGHVPSSTTTEEEDVAHPFEDIHVASLHLAANKASVAIDTSRGGSRIHAHSTRFWDIVGRLGCGVWDIRRSDWNAVLLQINKLVLETEGERSEGGRFGVLHLERQEFGGGDVALGYQTGTIYGLVQ